MPLTAEEVQHLRAALRGTFVQPALDVTVRALQQQLEDIGLHPEADPSEVFDRMPDSLALRWGRVYRDPATQCRLIAYASPSIMASGEFEGYASLTVWFCVLPSDYVGKPMDFMRDTFCCVRVLAVEPGARLLSDALDTEQWSVSARRALAAPFSEALAEVAPRCQEAVDSLADSLQP